METVLRKGGEQEPTQGSVEEMGRTVVGQSGRGDFENRVVVVAAGRRDFAMVHIPRYEESGAGGLGNEVEESLTFGGKMSPTELVYNMYVS